MRPSEPNVTPPWQDVRAACDVLQQAMDAMADQPEFTSMRPSIARAIALARDEKHRADHPEPVSPITIEDEAIDRLEAIAVTLAPSDVFRIIMAGRA